MTVKGFDDSAVLALIKRLDAADMRYEAATVAADDTALGRPATDDEARALVETCDEFHALLELLCASLVSPASAAGRAKAAWLRQYVQGGSSLNEEQFDALIAAASGGANRRKAVGEARLAEERAKEA